MKYPRWYAAAVLIAPLVQAAVLLALSLTSSVLLPAIFTNSDKATLLLSGVCVGLVGALLEEVDWTELAIPGLRLRHSILMTGVIVGMFWGVRHLRVVVAEVALANREQLSQHPIPYYQEAKHR